MIRLAGLYWMMSACAIGAAPKAALEAPPPVTHVIRLHRAATIGERTRVSTTVHRVETTVVKTHDTVLKEQQEEQHVRYVALQRVLDIDERGTPLRTEIAIEACEIDTPAGPEAVVAPGVLLTVTRGVEDSPFVAAEGEITDRAESILRMIIPTDISQYTDDDIFGTGTRQPVGGSWPVRADLAAQGYRGLEVPAGAIQGSVTLVATRTIAGGEHLDIHAQLSASGVRPLHLPAAATVSRGEIATTLSGVYPSDPSRPPLETTVHTRAGFLVDSEIDGRPLSTELTFEEEHRSVYEEVEPAS